MYDLIISVVGGGRGNATSEVELLAEQVGFELAKRGAIVACGGLGGVMEAVCKGAKSAGGTTIGILPSSDPEDANQYVDIPIPTGLGYARNAVVVKTGRAVIAIDGAYGTLSEIGHALADNIPVVALNTWTISRNGENDSLMIAASDPIDAVEKALKAAGNR